MIIIAEKGIFIRLVSDYDSDITSCGSGDEVHVLHRYKNWYEIILADDKTGWVRSFLLQSK